MNNEKIDWYPYYLLIEEFQKTYDFKVCNQLNLVNSVKIFRNSLIDEEYKEFKKGCLENNIVEIADGLGDTAYVILGSMWTFSSYSLLFMEYDNELTSLEETILEYFTPAQFDLIFREVHRSNMSKGCKNIDDVYATMAQEKYKNIKYRHVENKGTYNIIVDEDFPEMNLKKGKLLKSIAYSPANLEFVKDYEKV